MGSQPPSPQREWSTLPNFPPMSIVAKRLDQDGTWHGARPWSSPHCARWGHSSPAEKKGTEPPIFGPSLLWPNGWMHQDATWYGGWPQPRRLCVRWGPSHLPQKGQSPTQFSAHVYCGQTAAWIKMLLGTEVGLGLRDIVFNVHPATPRKRGTPTSTQFLAHVYCGQMAGWMKTALGMEVELGPGHIVLDGVPGPPKGAQQPPPLFGSCLLWPRSPISAIAELLFVNTITSKRLNVG